MHECAPCSTLNKGKVFRKFLLGIDTLRGNSGVTRSGAQITVSQKLRHVSLVGDRHGSADLLRGTIDRWSLKVRRWN